MDFGDYCLIEQKRYGCENEMYLHKVIGSLRSNVWVPVPVQSPATEEFGGGMADVIRCICCGVSETVVRKYRIQDVQPNTKFRESESINFNEDLVQTRRATFRCPNCECELEIAPGDKICGVCKQPFAETTAEPAVRVGPNSTGITEDMIIDYTPAPERQDSVLCWKCGEIAVADNLCANCGDRPIKCETSSDAANAEHDRVGNSADSAENSTCNLRADQGRER